jgi:SAM-dependent methyltransferase
MAQTPLQLLGGVEQLASEMRTSHLLERLHQSMRREQAISSLYDRKYGPVASSLSRLRERQLSDSGSYLLAITRHLGYQQSTRIVHVGINDGTEVLPSRATIYGVDVAPSALERGRHCFPAFRFDFGFAEDLPYPRHFFDLYVSLKTLQCSLVDRSAAIREARRVLIPGGYALISIPTGYISEEGRIVPGHHDGGGTMDLTRPQLIVSELRREFCLQGFRHIQIVSASIEQFIVAQKL